jgi:hypothetical protein
VVQELIKQLLNTYNMATYIQSITDYVPQIQPFQPDYNFLSNVLQQRQSNYDKNYNQLSSVYSSLFNSPMSREVDIQKKDAFFKSIEQDIKKISGMDLSLQQNVDAASKVFQPFLDDKNLMNDIVKTKQNQNAVAKHYQLKSCIDPDKCGGQAWDTGLQEQMYKLEEFKKTTDDEALAFSMPEYTPYHNWKKEAIKNAKEEGYNVTQEYVNGPFIVKDTNGNLIKGGLYNLYKNTYGDDPRVNANYKTEAYVQRKNFVISEAAKYGSEEFAERAYLSDKINNSSKRIQSMQNHFNDIADVIDEKENILKNKAKNGELLPDEISDLDVILQKKAEINKTQKLLEITKNSIDNNADSTDLNILRFKADSATAYELEEADLMDMAKIMSMRGAKRELDVNPYVLAETTSNLALSNAKIMEDLKFRYKLNLMDAKFKYAVALKDKEAGEGVTSKATKFYPSGSIDFNVDDKAVTFKNNVEYITKIGSDTENINSDLIMEMVNVTKQAALSKDNPSANAIQILNSTFGPGWSNINNQESLLKHLVKINKSSDIAFNELNTLLDAKRNPTSNLDWANSYITQSGNKIQYAKELNIANDLLNQEERTNWKTIVDDIKERKNSNPIFYNADLFLNSKGDIVNKEEFKRKYDESYRGQGGDADKVYDIIEDEFFSTYNKKVPGWNQGSGLPIGGSATQAAAIRYSNISPKRPSEPNFERFINLADAIFDPNQKPFVTAVLGSDAVGENIPELMNLVENLYSDSLNPSKKGVNPIITYDEQPIAGGNKDISAVTIRVNNAEDYFKNSFGTVNNPTPLTPYKNQLLSGEGITLFYNNKTVRTPTTEITNQYDPLELIVKKRGYVLDSWSKGGKIEFKYNPSNGMVTPTGTVVKYKDSTGKSYNSQFYFKPFDISETRAKVQYYEKVLQESQNHNINKAEPFILEREKAKQNT